MNRMPEGFPVAPTEGTLDVHKLGKGTGEVVCAPAANIVVWQWDPAYPGLGMTPKQALDIGTALIGAAAIVEKERADGEEEQA